MQTSQRISSITEPTADSIGPMIMFIDAPTQLAEPCVKAHDRLYKAATLAAALLLLAGAAAA